ncbi:MAG: Holliday junction resolvase RuvX [Pseudomonadota bacterium]
MAQPKRIYETPLPDFTSALRDGVRVMGLDISKSVIGLALSDPDLKYATPLGALKRTKFTEDAAALLEVMDAHGAGGLILGLPLNMDGSEGPRAQSVKAFARNLKPLTDAPIAFIDESLTTAEAEDALAAASVKAEKRARRLDETAAAIILQNALDTLNAPKDI